MFSKVLIAKPNIVYIDYIYNILFLNNITNMLIILTMTTTSETDQQTTLGENIVGLQSDFAYQ